MSGSVIGSIEVLALAGFVFTTSPSISSFGENFKDGSSCQFRICIVSSRWSGQCFGMLSIDILSVSSLSRLGAHSCLSMCRKSLFVPSMRPLTHGEYVAMTWVLVPHFLHSSHTSLLSKCFPPSVSGDL